ncbi:FecR domain-containing protein [Patescibacteria group bacterium]|nr:FecR domain-containing protein [Patescibacteria group bacterium]MBU1015946.1 FecR domain-containing protein [Patescibacteria group bacterium]MBU1938411.1 FecR domain-containing protein [Patescibacteria group bacterium]
MTTYKTGKGFTMVELLIVVAILAILSSVAYIGIQRSRVGVMNTKVTVDISAIENAMEQYKRDHEGKYPIPTPGADKNLSCFYLDTAYAHDCDDKADFIQSQIDNTLLTKRYLQEVPTDPRTGARYVYGVTTDGQYYQIAGIIENDDGTYSAKVAGNLHFTYPLKSLIRSYNSPDFVMDGESYLPYSPDHLALTATIQSITGTVEVDAKPASDGDTISPGSVITTAPASTAVLYFSDGSITYLDPDTTLRLLPNSEVEKNDGDGIITKIRLKLTSGKIWNKVIRLASESEFNIETTSAIAGVRGTEFGINSDASELIVLSGIVVARTFAPGEAVATSGSFEFDNSVTFFNANQVIIGDGTFKVFPVPVHNATVLSTGTSVSSQKETDLKAAHYETPYTNALQPRILEIDIPSKILSLQLIQKAANSPFPFPEPDKVLVFDENDNLLETWNSPSHYTVDSVSGSIDILSSAVTTFLTTHPNKSVIFAFEDKNGNLTAKSSPAVTLNSKTHVTYAMFYGDETPKKTKMVTAPSITAFPASLKLGSPPATLTADKSCDWTIKSGGGKLMGAVSSVQTATYVSIDPGLTVTGLIADIGSRFNSTANDAVTVRCIDPSDTAKYDEKTFTVAYEPAKKSLLSNYEYSWFAKGSTNWYEAKATCGGWSNLNPPEQTYLTGQGFTAANFPGLTEGGVPPGTWHLPSQVKYDGLDPTPNKTNPAEGALWCGTWTGIDCDYMPAGVASIWLLEEQNVSNAWNILGSLLSQIQGSDKTDNSSWRGVRCVR